MPPKNKASKTSSSKPSESLSPPPAKKRIRRDPNLPSPPPRQPQACETCRKRKIRCGGMGDAGEPCPYCVKRGQKCELSSIPSTDRAAASRRSVLSSSQKILVGIELMDSCCSSLLGFLSRRKLESERLAAGRSPVLIPAPNPTSAAQNNAPSSVASTSKLHSSSPKPLPKHEPDAPPPLTEAPAAPSTPLSPALARPGSFWLFFVHTPGVVRIGGVPGGMEAAGKDRRRGMMLLSRFEASAGRGESILADCAARSGTADLLVALVSGPAAYSELAWIEGISLVEAGSGPAQPANSAPGAICELKKEVICVSTHQQSGSTSHSASEAPLAKFTFDSTGEDSTLVSITSLPMTPDTPAPDPFLQALLNASPIAPSSSPVLVQLSTDPDPEREDKRTDEPGARANDGAVTIEGEMEAFWLLGVGPVEGEK